jgi:ribose transport system ATP-binding protein
MESEARKVLDSVGLELDVNRCIEEISEADKSLIDLAKALRRKPQILILDEMTAPLISHVVEELFQIIRKLKEVGSTIIFISHRLEEVLRICDEIIVLKDGNYEGVIDNSIRSDIAQTRKQIVRMMTGTEKGLDFPPKAVGRRQKPPVLTIRNLSNNHIRGITLEVQEGEIVALAGLDGQGQSTLLRAIAGLLPHIEGEILLCGKSLQIRNPFTSINNGIFYLSDKRDEEELWLSHNLWLNASVPSISERTLYGFINLKRDFHVIQDLVSSLRIEPPTLSKIVHQLSGGNRQKVVLGKYLLSSPKILLMDQPTIGLDVRAKVEFYHLLRKLADKGIPTLTVLTDLEEVVNLPNRILVMHEGRITKEFCDPFVDEEELLDSYYG